MFFKREHYFLCLPFIVIIHCYLFTLPCVVYIHDMCNLCGKGTGLRWSFLCTKEAFQTSGFLFKCHFVFLGRSWTKRPLAKTFCSYLVLGVYLLNRLRYRMRVLCPNPLRTDTHIYVQTVPFLFFWIQMPYWTNMRCNEEEVCRVPSKRSARGRGRDVRCWSLLVEGEVPRLWV